MSKTPEALYVRISKMKKSDTAVGIVAIIVILAIAYGGYSLTSKLNSTKKELASVREELTSTTETLNQTAMEKSLISEQFESEKSRNDDLESRVADAESVLGIIVKKQNTDPELLQKYSKVYFLNENYRPEKMDKIATKWVVADHKDEYIHEKVYPFLKDMLEDAAGDDIDLRIISAFRSFEEQSILKSEYTTVYGSGANQFSADQGYSEHQLGTTIDISTVELGNNFTNIEQTPAFKWLQDNAYKYGFILSYPQDNTYYQYEPWHWRFVGKDLARYLYKNKKNFYNLDQRDIDEYIVELFD